MRNLFKPKDKANGWRVRIKEINDELFVRIYEDGQEIGGIEEVTMVLTHGFVTSMRFLRDGQVWEGTR